MKTVLTFLFVLCMLTSNAQYSKHKKEHSSHPFGTGLVVGGFAVIIITLIAKFSDTEFKQILKSLSIVLLIKVTISPNTPFPAYIAVSFQAFIGYVLFSILNINFGSILLFSVLAMLESAIQKLLVLTLFFGQLTHQIEIYRLF